MSGFVASLENRHGGGLKQRGSGQDAGGHFEESRAAASHFPVAFQNKQASHSPVAFQDRQTIHSPVAFQHKQTSPCPAAFQDTQTSCPVNLRQFHTEVACACHDGHNALKWATQSQFPDPNLLSNIYVSLQAYRRGFLMCIPSLGNWLAEVIEAVPATELPNPDALEVLYKTLSVPADLLEIMAHEMRIQWIPQRGKLLISMEFLGRDSSIEELSSCLLECWRFPSFSSSRWASMGLSCRRFLLSANLGYIHMFQHMRSQNIVSEYEGNGADKMGSAELHMVAVTALCSFIPDAFLCRVLEDSRLVRHGAEIWDEITEEHSYLDELPPTFWASIAGLIGVSPSKIRDEVMLGSNVAWAYLEWKVFQPLFKEPWIYVVDPTSGLQELAEMEIGPADGVSWKLWRLLRQGHNQSEILTLMQLLRDTSWSSFFTEKQHASTSVIHKYQKEVGHASLSSRAFCHTFRPVLSLISYKHPLWHFWVKNVLASERFVYFQGRFHIVCQMC